MAIQLRPNYPEPYMSRGIIYYVQSKTDLAFADFDQAVKLAPRSAQALFLRSAAYNKKGDASHAQADMAAAKLLDPKIVEEMASIGFK